MCSTHSAGPYAGPRWCIAEVLDGGAADVVTASASQMYGYPMYGGQIYPIVARPVRIRVALPVTNATSMNTTVAPTGIQGPVTIVAASTRLGPYMYNYWYGAQISVIAADAAYVANEQSWNSIRDGYHGTAYTFDTVPSSGVVDIMMSPIPVFMYQQAGMRNQWPYRAGLDQLADGSEAVQGAVALRVIAGNGVYEDLVIKLAVCLF
jgi:hypothetical protein